MWDRSDVESFTPDSNLYVLPALYSARVGSLNVITQEWKHTPTVSHTLHGPAATEQYRPVLPGRPRMSWFCDSFRLIATESRHLMDWTSNICTDETHANIANWSCRQRYPLNKPFILAAVLVLQTQHRNFANYYMLFLLGDGDKTIWNEPFRNV